MSNTSLVSFGRFIADKSPTILTVMGVTGLVGTVVLAVKATPEAMRRIEDEDALRGSDDPMYYAQKISPMSKLDHVKAGWKPYIPAALSGAVSIACILGANSVHNKRNAAVIGLYTLSESAYKEYREKVASTIGDKKEREVRSEIVKDHILENPARNTEIFVTGTGDQLCYDDLTGRYFMSSAEKIRKAQNDVNATCINDMYASQNDFYRLIGLPPVALGEEVGWRPDVMMDISFDSHLDADNKPCLALVYRVAPIRGYYKGF